MTLVQSETLRNKKRYINNSAARVSELLEEIYSSTDFNDKEIGELVDYLFFRKRTKIDLQTMCDIVAHPLTPTTVFEYIIANEPSYVFSSALRNPNTPDFLLEKIFDKNIRHLMVEIASHSNISENLIEKFFVMNNGDIDRALINNKAIPVEVVERIAARTTRLVMTILLSRHRTPSSVLEKIMDNPNISPKISSRTINVLRAHGFFEGWPDEWINAHYGVSQ